MLRRDPLSRHPLLDDGTGSTLPLVSSAYGRTTSGTVVANDPLPAALPLNLNSQKTSMRNERSALYLSLQGRVMDSCDRVGGAMVTFVVLKFIERMARDVFRAAISTLA